MDLRPDRFQIEPAHIGHLRSLKGKCFDIHTLLVYINACDLVVPEYPPVELFLIPDAEGPRIMQLRRYGRNAQFFRQFP